MWDLLTQNDALDQNLFHNILEMVQTEYSENLDILVLKLRMEIFFFNFTLLGRRPLKGAPIKISLQNILSHELVNNP